MAATDKEALLLSITQFNEHLQKIKNQCDVLKEEIEPQLQELSPKEQAKVNCALAYSTHALLWMYFKSQGTSGSQMPAQKELARIQGYFKRLDNQENPETDQTPHMKIDKGAADRFIKANIEKHEPNLESGKKRVRQTKPQKPNKKHRK